MMTNEVTSRTRRELPIRDHAFKKPSPLDTLGRHLCAHCEKHGADNIECLQLANDHAPAFDGAVLGSVEQLTQGEGVMGHDAIREGRLNEAKRAFNRIAEYAGATRRRTADSAERHAIAGALIVIAEQGEERIAMERVDHERAGELIEMDKHRIKLLEGMAAPVVDNADEAPADPPVGRIRTRDADGEWGEWSEWQGGAHELAVGKEYQYSEGPTLERDSVQRNRITAFERGYEIGVAYSDATLATLKQVVDAYTEFVAEMPGGVAYSDATLATLKQVVDAYTDLMAETPGRER